MDEIFWGKLVWPTHTEHSDNARRAILRLYSMETPLYSTLNRATGFRDERAIPTLGPYAFLLHHTISIPPTDNKARMKEMATETLRDKDGKIMKFERDI